MDLRRSLFKALPGELDMLHVKKIVVNTLTAKFKLNIWKVHLKKKKKKRLTLCNKPGQNVTDH